MKRSACKGEWKECRGELMKRSACKGEWKDEKGVKRNAYKWNRRSIERNGKECK